MRLLKPLLALLVLAQAAVGSSPAAAVTAARADAALLPEKVRVHSRYLSLYHVPAQDVPRWEKVLAFHVNTLSREAELEPPVKVADRLYRVYLPHYGWSRKTFEKLLDVEPYFHAKVLVQGGAWVSEYHPGGGGYAAGTYQVWRPGPKVKKQAQAPWLVAEHAASLAALTQTQIPVVRGDWFLFQTAIASKDQGRRLLRLPCTWA
jgi:hypothetical protein